MNLSCKDFQQMIAAFEKDELVENELDAFLSHYRSCHDCREELSIRMLVDEGMQHLEAGESFHLQKEVKNAIDLAGVRLKRRSRLSQIAYCLEIVTVGLVVISAMVVLFFLM